MRIAVCYNLTPATLRRGEERDRTADLGVAHEAEAVNEALAGLGHDTDLIVLDHDLHDFVLQLRKYAPQLVFNLCEGFCGNAHREMNVAALFELLNLPFTGSSALCLGLTQDKIKTKMLLSQKGLATPKFLSVQGKEKLSRVYNLSYPLIAKPSREDASLGISPESVVGSWNALVRRVEFLKQNYRQPVLIEEFIDGREINVTILGAERLTVLPPAEIQFDATLSRPLVCFDGKWSTESTEYRGTHPVCPADLGAKEKLLIEMASLSAVKLLGCRDYMRVDIRLRDQVPYILEINANPDISPDSGVARAAAAKGLSYPQLLETIINSATARQEKSPCAH